MLRTHFGRSDGRENSIPSHKHSLWGYNKGRSFNPCLRSINKRHFLLTVKLPNFWTPIIFTVNILKYCRFGSVRENLIFAKFREFVSSQI